MLFKDGHTAMNNETVYLADAESADFERARRMVDIVCAGDSITGWNNFGPASWWPFPTYPRFFQELCRPLNLVIADGGIAGEVSDNGPAHVRRYLELFPTSAFFVIGFGTNDLAMGTDLTAISRRILENMQRMTGTVRDNGKRLILLNVPDANGSKFTPAVAAQLQEKRDYHNGQLAEFCTSEEIPLADIRAVLSDRHLGDELHPNEDGAKLIAKTVFEVFRELDGSVSSSS